MRILVDIGHPAHVHFFKNAIRRLQADNHRVVIAARSKDVTTRLLDLLGFEYREISSIGKGRTALYREFVHHELALGKLVRRFKPDVLAAVGGALIAPVGRLTGTPTVVFTDTEHVSIDRYLTYPWATRICTPRAFMKDLGRTHHRYDGFHEMAYLSPDPSRIDRTVLEDLEVASDEPFSVIRFVSWQASHDLGYAGLSPELKENTVNRLGRHGKVFITSEEPLPARLVPHELRLPPHKIHDVLSLASLYFGEGATMATEAGILGTPSIYVSPLVGTMGNFQTLEAEGLVLSFRNAEKALDKAEALLADGEARATWRKRALAFGSRMTNVTDMICDQLLQIGAADRGRGLS